MKLINQRGREMNFGCITWRGHTLPLFYKKIIRQSAFVTPKSKRAYCPFCGCGSRKRDRAARLGLFGYGKYRGIEVEAVRCLRCKTGYLARVE